MSWTSRPPGVRKVFRPLRRLTTAERLAIYRKQHNGSLTDRQFRRLTSKAMRLKSLESK